MSDVSPSCNIRIKKGELRGKLAGGEEKGEKGEKQGIGGTAHLRETQLHRAVTMRDPALIVETKQLSIERLELAVRTMLNRSNQPTPSKGLTPRRRNGRNRTVQGSCDADVTCPAERSGPEAPIRSLSSSSTLLEQPLDTASLGYPRLGKHGRYRLNGASKRTGRYCTATSFQKHTTRTCSRRQY